MDDTQAVARIDLELRRGVLVLAVLSRLHAEAYGYALTKDLAAHGLEVDEGTLYPLLRRLESLGLLESEWRVQSGRPRRYYRASPDGRAAEEALWRHWAGIVASMARMTDDEEDEHGPE